MKKILFFLVASTILCSFAAVEKPLYKDPNQPIDKRVEDLLSRMTLQEKLAQLNQISGSRFYAGQKVDTSKLSQVLNGLPWGAVECCDLNGDNINEALNTVQRYMMGRTRLGIPTFTVTESIHGSLHDGSTIFPHSVAVGATFDTLLAHQMTLAISKELYSQGVNQTLSPGVDVVRDYRWGRVEESFGEDPYLVGLMAMAETNGYIEGGVNPMLKPFGPGSAPVGGLNLASVDCGERDLLNVYVKPVEMVVKNTSVSAVMSSYFSWNGIPNSSSHYLLTELLRDKWGFKGYVYSDWGATNFIKNFNKTAETYADAAVQCITAGLDLEVGGCYSKLGEALKEGKIDISVIDEAVRRVLRVKFQLGLFEHPYRGLETGAVMREPQTVALSRKISDESIVLVKNEKNLLPLKLSSLKSIAVIGPNADQVQFGNYTWSRNNKDGVTPLQGIRSLVGKKVKVNYARGCDLISTAEDGFPEAVDAVEKSDVALVFLGTSSAISSVRDNTPATCGEGHDITSLDLTGAQESLLETLYATGKPVVLVLVTGKPLSVKWAEDNIPAIVVQWYGGEKEGDAIADMLFGRTVPCGKLPFSFPQSVGHMPCYYNHLKTDKGFYHAPGSIEKPGRDYVFSTTDPLWEFGRGLSYTTFEYAPMQITPALLTESDTITVKTSVTNTGLLDAKEVVQLYFSDMVSSVVTPVRQLCAFNKVFVPAGKSVEVELKVPVSAFSLYNQKMEYVVEPGAFELQLGGSSLDIRQRDTVSIGIAKTEKSDYTGISIGKIGKSMTLRGVVKDIQATPVSDVTIKSLNSGISVEPEKDGTYSIKTNEGDVLEVSGRRIQTARFKVGSSDQYQILVYYNHD